MTTTTDLKNIFAAGRPLVERWLDLVEEFAGLRDAATAKGIDWGQVKALLKAQVQDEREGGDGKRVSRIVEKAEFASAYADMLGLGSANMNERNSISETPKPSRQSTATIAPAAAEPSRPVVDKPPGGTGADEDGIPQFLDRRKQPAEAHG